MAGQAAEAQKIIKIKNKSYGISKKEQDYLIAATARAWKPTIIKLKDAIENAHAMWRIHDDLRKGSFVTATIMEKVGGAKFPPESLIKSAEMSISKFEHDVKAGAFKAVPQDFAVALDETRTAATAVQKYHEALCSGGDSCITGLTNIRAAAVAIVEVTVAIETMGASAELQVGAAGVLGSYKEALTQIEKAGGPEKGSAVLAVNAVMSAGVRDALIGHFMKDGAFGKKIVDFVSKKAAAMSLKNCGSEVTAKIVEKMMADGSKEAIKTSLADLCNNFNGIKKMTLEQAVEHVGQAVIQKMAFAKLFGSLNKQIDKMGEKVFEKLVKGEFKGLDPIKDEKLKKDALKIVESTLEKTIQVVILNNLSSPQKLDNLQPLVVTELARDSAFTGKIKKLKK